MSTKSYVTLEQHVCPVCGTVFDTGNILLDRRLKDTFDKNTITGYSLCPEHQNRWEEGYIAFVEVTSDGHSDTLRPEDVTRTGLVAHIRKEVAGNIFNQVITTPLVYVQEGLIQQLQERYS